MPKPNILFIIADDQRADAFDWDFLPLPDFDRLLQTGTRFKNSFVHVPICTPGRAECLTGCHGYRNGVMWFLQPMREGCEKMPQTFQREGYHTIHIGKWHNEGHPKEHGYDTVHYNMHDADDFHNRYKQHGHWLRYTEANGESKEGHSTELFVQAAMDELRGADNSKPWFCWLALHSPHDPFHCPPPFDGIFENQEDFPLPPAYQAMPAIDNGDLTIRDELLLPHPRTPEAARRNFARYAAMIAHHDHWIERLLKSLEASGQLENTIICFTSDHGLAVGSNGFLGKENMYDHSCRVPLILSGPCIPQGQTVDHLTTSADLYPTLCSLAGISIPASVMDGKSLLPLMVPGAMPLREAVFAAFRSPQIVNGERLLVNTQRSVRTMTHKLNWYPIRNCFQFFSLEDDPYELDDLLQPWRCREDLIWGYQPPIPRENLEEHVTALKSALVAFLSEQGDPLATALDALDPLQ